MENFVYHSTFSKKYSIVNQLVRNWYIINVLSFIYDIELKQIKTSYYNSFPDIFSLYATKIMK